MAKKKANRPKSITNRRARYDYELDDSFVVGLSLTGAETKSLRLGHGHIKGAYVVIKDGELWLVNATITGSQGIIIDEQSQTRSRKLLAKKGEIEKLIDAKKSGMTIVPLEVLNRGRYIKLRISLARGKKRYDKREVIKKREESRRISSVLKRQ